MPSALIANVEKIEEIQPHSNADRMEMARVKNWWCVVKLNEFKVGDKIVYIPPETVVPRTVAESWGVANYCSKLPKQSDGTQSDDLRIRATRLRGVPSYGLILPLENPDWEVGHSVVEHYGLSKYDPPPPPNAGDVDREPPNFHRYTNIENIGNFPEIFEDGEEVVVDEKIHGMNGRTGLCFDHEGNMLFMAGSHRQRLKEMNAAGIRSTFWTPMDERMKELLKKVSENETKNVITFVEVFGRKVQDMEYGMNAIGYRAYDISVNGMYVSYDEKVDLFKEFDIEVAPLLYRGPFSMAKMREIVDGPTTLCQPEKAGRFKGREGIVIRPVVETTHPLLSGGGKSGRKILKMISIDYHDRKGNKTEYQ